MPEPASRRAALTIVLLAGLGVPDAGIAGTAGTAGTAPPALVVAGAPGAPGAAGAPGAEPAGNAAAASDLDRSLDELIAAKGRVSDGERLRTLFDVVWRATLRESPELATETGTSDYDDRWSDLSPAAIARRRAQLARVLAAVESIDRPSLGEAQRTDYDLFRRRARMDLEGSRFPDELLALDQLGGVQQDVPLVLALMPASSVAQYESILARLRGVPRLVEQTIALLERGLAAGVTAPRIVLRDVPGQVTALLVDDPLASPMLAAFKAFPATIPAVDQERLRRQAGEVFSGQVAPAYRRLRDFLVTAYVPRARESIAISALPGGEAWYAFLVRQATTTDLAPRQLHDLGLAEVARIRKEMDDLIAGVGWKGSFAEFLRFLRSDPRFFFERPEELLAAYRDICKRIDPQLVKLFGKLPRMPYGVQAMPTSAGKSQTVAYYDRGSFANALAGTYYVNTYDLKSHPKWAMVALTLHEAVPGHHIQISLAEELEELPAWRRFDNYGAFAEGWAFYAESLGTEIGMYQDPYSKFGQLDNQMWRAIRLVVDTGIHLLGWTRQQALDYCMRNAAKSEHVVTQEVDRYIAHPGGALAYKVGELKIRQLRTYAERELGASFDLRAFHDQVLGRGALPLDLLEDGVKAWVRLRSLRGTPPAGPRR
jgi:uncharacterized protein (DUF885 family)